MKNQYPFLEYLHILFLGQHPSVLEGDIKPKNPPEITGNGVVYMTIFVESVYIILYITSGLSSLFTPNKEYLYQKIFWGFE